MMTRPSPSTRSIADASEDWRDVVGGETTNDIERQPDEEKESATRTVSGTSMPLGLDGGDHFGTVVGPHARWVEQQRGAVEQQDERAAHQMTFWRTVATSNSRRSVSASRALRPRSVIW